MQMNTTPIQEAQLLSTTISQSNTEILCAAVVYRQGFSARLNTIWNYSEINRWKVKSIAEDQRIHSQAFIDSKTQIGSDSMVGDGTKIEERCSVKRSVIGKHCVIGKNVKISNSVIMDYVTIEDK